MAGQPWPNGHGCSRGVCCMRGTRVSRGGIPCAVTRLMERIDVCLDAGHGGTRLAGRSSPLGVQGQAGTLEKNVTLAIARRAAAHLGVWRVGLTRRSDENLSLDERAATSARGNARAFVSIHTNAGEKGSRGPET